MSDPFDIVKDEVQQALRVSNALYQRHQQLINGALNSQAEQEEVQWIRTQLDEQIKSLDADVADLDEAVKAVEANPKKFGQFDTLEIQARKLFIEQSKKEVKNIKEGAFSKAATAKLQKKQRENLLPTEKKQPVTVDSRLDNEVVRDNTDFMKQQYAEQNEVMGEQDQLADQASNAADRLKQVATDMGDEVGRQNKKLGGLQKEVDVSATMLGRARQRVDNFLKNNDDKPKIVIIIILVVVIFLLILGIIMVDAI